MIAIRGAVTADGNTREDILSSTGAMLREIMGANHLCASQIVSMVFTATGDLNQAYPAEAARELGAVEAGLVCLQEMRVEGSLPKCIRVMVLAETGGPQAAAKHVYLKGAAKLRPDLAPSVAIAIDGPAGAGKGALARNLAAALGFTYVDTGALYRAVAYFCVNMGADPADATKVEPILPGVEVAIKRNGDEQRVLVNGEDVTGALRSLEVSEASSKVAAIPAVREKLLGLQREAAAGGNAVLEGRDIGSNVLPGAKVKIYLDASLEERAKRRLKDKLAMGVQTGLADVMREIHERDERDTHRELSPLSRAPGAALIDSTEMGEQQVLAAALAIIYEKTGGLYGVRDS